MAPLLIAKDVNIFLNNGRNMSAHIVILKTRQFVFYIAPNQTKLSNYRRQGQLQHFRVYIAAAIAGNAFPPI